LNIAIVTSEVTYIPQNYNALIGELLGLGNVRLFINLSNRSPSLIIKGLGLIAFGAKKIGLQLIKNTVYPKTILRKNLCHKNKIKYFSFDSINEAEVIQIIKENKIDLILNIRTRCIYTTESLSAPRLGCINLHHGILPDYRGTMCDLYALYEGRGAGFSLHKMEAKIDAGTIYSTTEVSSTQLDYWQYLATSHEQELVKIKELLAQIESLGHLPEGIQNIKTSKTKYTKNPTKEVINKMISKGMIL